MDGTALDSFSLPFALRCFWFVVALVGVFGQSLKKQEGGNSYEKVNRSCFGICFCFQFDRL